ncbi:MAG: acetolactate synthase [Proteiniphilum sp.]|jgi:hypothetical protein|nr:acetolactate synthase [Proteiniphilum sp.]
MYIQQLSVFLEDRSGRLTELTRILAAHDINITALNLAETTDCGIVRMVAGKPQLARKVLEEAGFSIGLTGVVCVNIPDEPGSLYRILNMLTEENINIDYMYAFSNRDVALAVIRAEDMAGVTEALEKRGVKLLSQHDIYQL